MKLKNSSGGDNMDIPKMNVKCSVDNCHYYKGENCHAPQLKVDPLGDGRAETKDGTRCSTFQNRKK